MPSVAISTFPHETLGNVFSFCDAPTLAVVGRVNLACLELSSPFLYEDVDLKDTTSLELFLCSSPSTASSSSPSRIAPFLSLLQVRNLSVTCTVTMIQTACWDRIPGNLPLELGQLRFNVLEGPYNNALPKAGSTLRLLLLATNPTSFIFARGLPISILIPYWPGDCWYGARLDLTSFPWSRLETVVLAYTTLRTNTCTESHDLVLDRKSPSRARLIYDWKIPSSAVDHHLLRGLLHESWQFARWEESGRSSGCRVELWVESEERVQQMKDIVHELAGILGKDHLVFRRFLEIVAKPEGQEGYWEEERERRRRERRIG
ncbi:hypothetical protein BDY24DRAFT_390019 [Mrakia frigida]|uniref:uncharacterized protein n=1 Tax=Mrakia frigida TaxID=29902 RepID=UPI003FCC2235